MTAPGANLLYGLQTGNDLYIAGHNYQMGKQNQLMQPMHDQSQIRDSMTDLAIDTVVILEGLTKKYPQVNVQIAIFKSWVERQISDWALVPPRAESVIALHDEILLLEGLGDPDWVVEMMDGLQNRSQYDNIARLAMDNYREVKGEGKGKGKGKGKGAGTNRGFAAMTVPELRERCRERSLLVSGNKTVLLERLRARRSRR